MLRKNSLTLFFSIAKKVVEINVAVKKYGYFVNQRVLIVKGSLARMLNWPDEDPCDANEETADLSTFEQFINIQQEEEEIEDDMTVKSNFEEYELH